MKRFDITIDLEKYLFSRLAIFCDLQSFLNKFKKLVSLHSQNSSIAIVKLVKIAGFLVDRCYKFVKGVKFKIKLLILNSDTFLGELNSLVYYNSSYKRRKLFLDWRKHMVLLGPFSGELTLFSTTLFFNR